MKDKKVDIVGHRGAHGLAPENTIASFEKALEFAIDQVETDVRITKDNVIVHIHNPQLVGFDGSKLTVADTTYQELKAHKPDLATLDESITFTNRRVRMMIEIKAGVPTAPIITTIKKYLAAGWKAEDFMFAAFDYQILKEVYAALPEIERVVLETWSGMRATSRARRLNTPYLSMDQQFIWWGFVRATAKKYKLFTYPYPRTRFIPFNHKKPKRWIRHGLHGIITDYPDYFTSRRS